MSRLIAIVSAVWEFVVGDDPLTALGVVVGLGITAAVAGADLSAWWVMPVAVVLLLVMSLRRAAREGH
ncbi:MAG: hypothetical protein M3Z27_08805 [Actinomycetota bacterium]|nr:hypothetical protein [Actinomycetota bacterium]